MMPRLHKLRSHHIILLTVFALTSLSIAAFVLADTTGTLTPTADGGNDNSKWRNTGGSGCDSVDCYTEVDEGACDEDTSYIENNNADQIQSFDIDESSIPDDSTITQIDITTCHKYVQSGAIYRAHYCIDGSCTSGTDTTSGASYANNTESFTGLSITKSSSTDLEIAVESKRDKTIRVSRLSAVVTYTLPADTTAPAAVTDLDTGTATTTSMPLTWTAPGDDGSTGTATTYDVRYSTDNVTEGNWSNRTAATGEPTPSVASSSEAFTVSSLSVNTSYSFGLKTSDEVPNESGLSNVVNKYTLANAPVAAAESGITTSAITANWTINSNPAGTEFYAENTTSTTNSGWVADATSFVSSSLTTNTAYVFTVKARNGDAAETAATALGTTYTLANAPATAAFGSVTETSIVANWTANSNPSGTEYYVENTTAGTNSGWITDTTWTSSSLSAGTTYSFRVKARNGDNTDTAWVSLSNQATSDSSTVTTTTSSGTPSSGTTTTAIPSATGPSVTTPVIAPEPEAAEIGAPGTTTADTGTGETVTAVSILPTPGDVTPPVISITEPPQVIEDNRIIFAGTASEEGEPRGVIAGLAYSFDDGVSWHPVTTAEGLGTEQATFTVRTPALPDGTYTIKVRARDNTSNEGITGDPQVTIDLLPAIFGSVVLLDPSGSAYPTANLTVAVGSNIRVIASFAGGVIQTTVSLDNNHFPLEPDPAKLRWAGTIHIAEPGETNIRLRARDGAENTFDQIIGTIVAVPALQIVDPAENESLPGATVTLERFDPQALIWRTDKTPGQVNPQSTTENGSILLSVNQGKFRIRVQKSGYWNGVTESFSVNRTTALTGNIALPQRQWFKYLIPARTRPLPLPAHNLLATSEPTVNADAVRPQLILTDITGAERDLAEFAGHRIIITTIASWNRTSHEQLVILNRLQAEVGKDVTVIPWLVQQPGSVLAGILQRGQYDLEGFVDLTGQDSAELGRTIFPSHFFFDRAGILRKSLTGFATTDKLLEILRELQ